MRNSGNLIIGLTGGMGCGKSTVAELFANRGFRRLDADRVVREELLPDPEVKRLLRERFGPGVIREGEVDRRAVAERVFASPSDLEWLETLLHPRIRVKWEAIFRSVKGERFICEVPLLFEKGLEKGFDLTVCVTTDSALQLRRLEQRGISPELARQRIAKQLPLARKCELADFVILNDGSLEFLEEQVSALAQRFSLSLIQTQIFHGSSPR